MKTPTRRPADTPHTPIVWFGELLQAFEQGDYRRLAKAQRALYRLGWSVMARRSHWTTRQARHEEGGGR